MNDSDKREFQQYLYDLEKRLTQKITNFWPIGSLYFNSLDSRNPSLILSFGVWEAALIGRTLAGKSSSGTFATLGTQTGAETHTLTTAEMPAHTHSVNTHAKSASNGAFTEGAPNSLYGGQQTGPAGNGASHNNIQPTEVVMAWVRVS